MTDRDWDQSYADGDTPWDLRGPTPPLQALIARDFFARLELPPGARVAVPGCGRGHDLRVFAELGWRATGFDISPAGIEEARQLLELNQVAADVLCRDVLGLLPEFADSFDLLFDYTCFCCLRPHLRLAFGEIAAGMVRSGGWLLTLAFPMGGPLAEREGPPYLVQEQDLHDAFGNAFLAVDSFFAENSPPERNGHERFYLWRRRPA